MPRNVGPALRPTHAPADGSGGGSSRRGRGQRRSSTRGRGRGVTAASRARERESRARRDHPEERGSVRARASARPRRSHPLRVRPGARWSGVEEDGCGVGVERGGGLGCVRRQEAPPSSSMLLQNAYGELGLEDTSSRSTPTMVGFARELCVTQVRWGGLKACRGHERPLWCGRELGGWLKDRADGRDGQPRPRACAQTDRCRERALRLCVRRRHVLLSRLQRKVRLRPDLLSSNRTRPSARSLAPR